MVERGMTHEQIAKEHGVGRSAVSAALSRAGLTNPVRYDDTIPWRVKLTHSRHYDLWMLRVGHRLTHDLPATPDEVKRFTSWERDLNDAGAVITYLPDTEEGFHWVERQEGDAQWHRPPTN